MWRKFKVSLILLGTLFIIAGCGKKDLGNTYVEGMDYQYMYKSDAIFTSSQAKGENGYFFCKDKFIYYLEDETQRVTPLCNKADCLHDAEQDTTRRKSCNAHVNSGPFAEGTFIGIAYCDGYLYCVDIFDDGFKGDELEGQALYRIKEDGSQKEMLYQWEDPTVKEWCIHRNGFYYVEKYIESEPTVKSGFCVKYIDLDSMVIGESEVIYDTKDLDEVYAVNNLCAYGNYIYFIVFGVSGTSPNEFANMSAKEQLDYTFYECFVYDLQKKELTCLEPMDNPYMVVTDVVFWQDKLIWATYDLSEQDKVEDVYWSELDGTNPQVLLENMRENTKYYSDGEYLYCSNSFMVEYEGLEETPTMVVYDKEMNIVDTFEMPWCWDREIGDSSQMFVFLQYDDKGKWQIIRFDKSKLGTYNGKMMEYDVIFERNLVDF